MWYNLFLIVMGLCLGAFLWAFLCGLYIVMMQKPVVHEPKEPDYYLTFRKVGGVWVL